jgi:hypothetical protein
MTYVDTRECDIRVYKCAAHGEWHLGPGGIYDPRRPPLEVRALVEHPARLAPATGVHLPTVLTSKHFI